MNYKVYDVNLRVPKHVNELLTILTEHGYEAFLIGGCVRDSLLNLSPKDWDITTNAKPEEVMSLFSSLNVSVLPVGIEYGTVVVYYKNDNYEITTYRSDGVYEDGRRPSNVFFESSLENDVLRRDLTINALAYNPNIGLVDYVGGYEDLNNRRLRFVGNIWDRLNEDSLRGLRYLRFLCKFNFVRNMNDIEIVCNHFKENYQKLSIERVTQEIIKLFEYPYIVIDNLDIFIKLLSETVIPEIKPMINCTQNNKHHCYDVYYHTLNVMKHCWGMNDTRLIFAAMLHDIGKPVVKKKYADGTEHFVGHPEESARIAKEILTRLKLSNSFIDDVVYLVRNHDNFNQGYKIANIRRFVASSSEKNIDRWLKLRAADINSQVYFKEKTDRFNEVNNLIIQCRFDGSAIKLSDLKINGNDILAMDIEDKRDIKYILEDLLNNCYGAPELNNREWLLRYANKLVIKSNNASKWADVNAKQKKK